MLKNYLKIAWRSLWKNKLSSGINLLGLAVGFSVFLLIMLYIRYERSYENFLVNGDRIFRVNQERIAAGEVNRAANTTSAVAPTIKEEFSGVEQYVRFMIPMPGDLLISTEQEKFYENGLLWADPEVFDMFGYPLLRGNPKEVLTKPFTIVLSEKMALKYFGKQNPIGQKVKVKGWFENEYEVTGVFEDLPENTHLKFDFLASLVGEKKDFTFLFDERGRWDNPFFYSYVLLSDKERAIEVSTGLPGFAKRHLKDVAKRGGFEPDFSLIPIKDIHLNTDFRREREANTNKRYLYIFSFIAFLILLIACINFINLSTAFATRRAKEVGIRKVTGASQWKLIGQFLGESALLCFTAFLLGLFIAEGFLPGLNRLIDRNLSLIDFFDPLMILLTLVGLLIVILLAGAYPALYLSGFKPVEVLKAQKLFRPGSANLRKSLVVFQFFISTLLIGGTLLIWKQMSFMQAQPKGFDEDQILVLQMRADKMQDNPEPFRQELLQHPAISLASTSSGVPGKLMFIDNWPIIPEKALGSEQYPMTVIGADEHYLDLLNIPIVSGRNFSTQHQTDAQEAFIINEAAAKTFGWDDPIGKEIELVEGDGKKGRIVGMIKDFHLRSMHHAMEPIVIHQWPSRYITMSLKLRSERIEETIDYISQKWSVYAPNLPFEYTFLDESFAQYYQSEQRIGKLFSAAAILAILISSLGLFGLATFLLLRRTKEIGIRKVLGSSISSILFLVTKDYIRLVFVGYLLALPLGIWLINKWLANYAFHIELGFGYFILPLVVLALIALTAVSYQALKAALSNPVEALRNE